MDPHVIPSEACKHNDSPRCATAHDAQFNILNTYTTMLARHQTQGARAQVTGNSVEHLRDSCQNAESL